MAPEHNQQDSQNHQDGEGHMQPEPTGVELPHEPLHESTETPRVSVRGRIGRLPEFRTIPQKDDLLVGHFSVAEHPTRDETVWHEIVVFGERAKQLQAQVDAGQVTVGQEMEVVGYRHRRERPTKDGGTRLVEEIYAATMKPVNVTKPPTPSET